MFSGDANVVDAILQVMCFSRDPKLWNVHMLDLERYKHLCEEPLPLNGSGETPLEVAMKAGHFDEIVQVYEALGLPKTIKDQLWLARCTAAMKKIAEKRKPDERTRQFSSLNSYYNRFMDSSDDEDDSNEDVSNCIFLAVIEILGLLKNFLVFLEME